jgi:xanthine dehydrogenase small subunit
MRTAIRFVQNGKIREIENIDPTTTVLNFLRYQEALTGTKEGCAEGDCGACTVVLGSFIDGRIKYQAVNACIQFLPMLDGKELITVEDLKSDDGELHPVQTAMVEANGTQCGFCTPGFVMSLFADYHSEAVVDRNHINNVLAGNLCRCTGYGPIIEAGLKTGATRSPDKFSRRTVETAALLKELSEDSMLCLTMNERSYFAPTTIDELTELLDQYPQAVLMGGATDIGLWVTKLHKSLDIIIYLGKIPGLSEIQVQNDCLEIGAMVTYSDAWSKIADLYPDFGELIRRIASTQIRNTGTIGGNIANGSPIGDTPPPLIALGATLILGSKSGSREIPLEEFFIAYGQQNLKPGEYVQSVRIPAPQGDSKFSTYKLSKRFDQDISAVCGAFNVTLSGNQVSDIRICYGGMAATPQRAGNAEKALIGNDWTLENIEIAMQAMTDDYTPMSDMRASSDYRALAARNLLKKFYLECSAPDMNSRLIGEARPDVA